MSVTPERIPAIELLQNDSSNQTSQCNVCGKVFAKKSNMTRHFKTLHGIDLLPRTVSYKCDPCSRQFNSLSQLRCHQKKQHFRRHNDKKSKNVSQHTDSDLLKSMLLEDEDLKEQNKRTSEVKKHECPLCNESFCRPDFPCHFQKKHKLTLQKETLEFDSFSDFLEWKAFIEEETKSNYYKERTSKYGEMSYHYFICNRSGTYKAKNPNARFIKGQGSCKMNAYCPSSIRVQERNDGNCLVTYQKVHVGHKEQLDLSVKRQGIAAKITSNIPFDYMLEKVDDDLISEDELNGSHLPKKDFHEIKNSYLYYSQSDSLDGNINSMEKSLNESRSRQFYMKQNQQDYNLMSEFAYEDSERSTASLKEENEICSLQERKESLIRGFTEVVRYASTSEEYDILEKALASLKPKIDAIR